MHLYVNIRICIAVYVHNISKHRFNFPINVEMDPRHSVPVLASQTFCPAFLSRENVLCPFVTLFCPSVVLSREMPFCPANKRGQTAPPGRDVGVDVEALLPKKLSLKQMTIIHANHPLPLQPKSSIQLQASNPKEAAYCIFFNLNK